MGFDDVNESGKGARKQPFDRQAPLGKMGLSVSIGRLELIGIVVATSPLAFFASSVQSLFVYGTSLLFERERIIFP